MTQPGNGASRKPFLVMVAGVVIFLLAGVVDSIFGTGTPLGGILSAAGAILLVTGTVMRIRGRRRR